MGIPIPKAKVKKPNYANWVNVDRARPLYDAHLQPVQPGELGRYDPLKKSWKVWPLPKSREGCYAVYVDDKDMVWVSDWPANAIHRFDPATERFASFPSNRPRADVRQMLGRPGEVWAAESGTDRLVLIKE